MIFVLILCLPVLTCFHPVEAADYGANAFSGQELDDLLAPIALYPDPLLAQILPAATYPAEVSDAAAWLRSGGSIYDIDAQNWDENVRAIAHYPDILYMMSANMDWTADLGDAFLNQPDDITDAIQRLRWRAREAGNLASTNEQSVIIEDGYIQIIPAQPEYIYIPRYDPEVVYVQRPDAGPSAFIAFGLGLAIGEWLNMDFDWGGHNIIYHGWNRRGWVDRARPHVHRSNTYINKSRPFINQRWTHDASRGNPDRYRRTRTTTPNRGIFNRLPEIRGKEITPTRPARGMFGPRGDTRPLSNRGRESRTIQPARSVPEVVRGAPHPRAVREGPHQGKTPSAADINRGRPQPPVQPPAAAREPQRERTPSGGFGGYRGAGETKKESLRGQSSRQNGQGERPASAPAGRAPNIGRKGAPR
jgi:hypothetical protein